MADKGFIVQHILDDYGVRIDTSVKLEGKKQFTEEDVHNRKNSQVRVHVERAIRRIKVFRILQEIFLFVMDTFCQNYGKYVAG